MAVPDLLSDLASELRRVVRPVEDALASEEAFAKLLAEYGWLVDPTTIDITEISDAFAILGDLGALGQSLGTVLTASPDETEFDQFADLVSGFKSIISRLRDLSSIPALASLPRELWTTFSQELLDGSVAEYLRTYRPLLFALAVGAGVIEEERVDVAGTPGRQNYVRRTVEWDRLATLLTDPLVSIKEVSAWGAAGEPFAHELLFERIARLVSLIGLTGELREPSAALVGAYYSASNPHRPEARELHIVLARTDSGGGDRFEGSLFALPIPAEDPSEAPGGLVIGTAIELIGEAPASALSPYSITFSGAFAPDRSARLEVRPSGARMIPESPGDKSIDAAVALSSIDQPLLLLGSWFSHHLRCRGWTVRFRVLGLVHEPEIQLELAYRVLELVLDSTDFDGFLREVASAPAATLPFDCSIVWSSKTGLHFRGGGALDLVIPVHATMGAIEVSHLTAGLRAAASETAVVTSVTGSAKLGPVVVGVANVGLKLVLTPVPENRAAGVLGDLDLDFAFKPPTGLGLAIDAGPVTGGGFLSFEEDQYSGAVALKIAAIAVSAYGIIETKLPGGGLGYSFLLVISAKFPKPIELGLGIKLVEVGGLVGIQRTVAQEALQKTLQSGVLDHLLFPEDPIGQAPAIFAALRDLFPVAEGRYTFGPMARLTWGTPTVVQAKLGFFLEVPEPIRLLVLGTIAAGLPNLDQDRVRLNLDVVGLLELTQKRFALDGRLRDSLVGGYPVKGDMALRLAWGDSPDFVLSVGGLNPHYSPPPGFPALKSVTVDLTPAGNPRITLQGYLAVTPNTAQVGAKAELYAEKGPINIYGWLGFDALFVFVPFSFMVDLSGGVAIRRKSKKLATVHLDATLSGPSPFHAKGRACVSLFFFDACVPFDATFGTAQPPELPKTSAADLRKLLGEALADLGNWEATFPTGGSAVVSVATDRGAGTSLFDPLGSATLRQRVLPLGMRITRFGGGAVEPPTTFEVKSVELNRVKETDPPAIEDFFAPAQFRDMTDAEKLSSPSFEKRPAGFTVRSGAVAHGTAVKAALEVETVLVVPEEEVVKPLDQTGPVPLHHFDAMLPLAGAATGGLRATGFDKFADPAASPQAALGEESFVIAGRRDGAPAAGLNNTPWRRTEALFRLRDHLAEHPEDRGRLEVLPAWEVTP